MGQIEGVNSRALIVGKDIQVHDWKYFTNLKEQSNIDSSTNGW